MVLPWAIAGLGSAAAAGVVIRRLYRWQSKAEASRIVRAIERGDTCELAMLWAERFYPEAVRDWFGNPPLIVAARCSMESARTLLCLGAAVDERGVGWMTALMHAAFAGDRELCELLLAFGADRDARDALGCSAASWAESAGHSRLADMLALPPDAVR